MNAISLGLIKPTGEIVTQMNMTPDEVRAAGLYYPQPSEPTGEIMDMIKQHQGELEEDQYHLAIQFLKDYGLCRYTYSSSPQPQYHSKKQTAFPGCFAGILPHQL